MPAAAGDQRVAQGADVVPGATSTLLARLPSASRTEAK